MSYRPEHINSSFIDDRDSKRAARRKRTAKRANTRVRRRAERRDPETAAPRVYAGWVS